MDDFVNWIVQDLALMPEILVVVRLGVLNCACTLVGLFLLCFTKRR